MTSSNGTRPAPVLAVEGLSVSYASRSASSAVPVVRDVGFELRPGRVLGLVGESGSGKSTAALAAIGWTDRVMRRTAGASVLDGTDLCALAPDALRRQWGRHIGYLPQEIGGALHPTFRIGSQFRETLRVNCGLRRSAADERAVELLEAVNISSPREVLRRHPHQLSGGQLQRVALALALAPQPEVLILDEPTTGLDVSSQQRVVSVLRRLVEERSVAVLFITHDVALLSELADDLAVMYAGEIVEAGPADEVTTAPRHPYTSALLDAVPSPAEAVTTRGIPGLPPGRVVDGECAFASRCPHTTPACRAAVPPLTEAGDVGGHGWAVRCVRAGELELASQAGARRQRSDEASDVLLEVRGLTCGYGVGARATTAVSDVSLQVAEGRVTALVGESGSGKSTIGRAIAGVLRPLSGDIVLGGAVLPADPRHRTRQHRHDIQLVLQNPGTALNPRRTTGDLLAHVASRFVAGDRAARAAAVDEVLEAVQLGSAVLDRYPSQLSGGQRQRVAIAAAFVARPRLVVCDEITSGQDVSVQAVVLDTLAGLQQRSGTAVLFIAHDLGIVRSIADHVYVLQRGSIVESGPTEALFEAPVHAYTRSLLDAVPAVHRRPEPRPVFEPEGSTTS